MIYEAGLKNPEDIREVHLNGELLKRVFYIDTEKQIIRRYTGKYNIAAGIAEWEELHGEIYIVFGDNHGNERWKGWLALISLILILTILAGLIFGFEEVLAGVVGLIIGSVLMTTILRYLK